MRGSTPFDQGVGRYEAWFEDHRNAYEAEVRAVRELMPATGDSVEIGVGTGRFAVPLRVPLGLDPSPSMLRVARNRGVEGVMGIGENLPFPDASFDTALMVTTVCFLADVHRAFQEVRRILRREGRFVMGLVDKTSPLGRAYMERREESEFYRVATFYSVEEIVALSREVGFDEFDFRQTLFGSPRATPAPQRVKDGYGVGSFVVIRASVSGG